MMTSQRKRSNTESIAKNKHRPSMSEGVLAMSDKCLAVSGCRGISEYSSSRIRLSLKKFELTAEGKELTVRTYCGDEIEVRGKIEAVFFGKYEAGGNGNP